MSMDYDNKVELSHIEFERHADFNNPSIFWIIQEWETVTDLKNHYLCETYIKNMELIMDTLEEPICQIALYKALD